MTEPQVDDRVQLMLDIPELGLRRGDLGLVCSTWFSPTIAYEVEFWHKILGYGLRALLMSNQIQKEFSQETQGTGGTAVK